MDFVKDYLDLHDPVVIYTLIGATIILLIFIFSNRSSSAAVREDDFIAPDHLAKDYLKAKEATDMSDIEQVDALQKKLMERVLAVVPYILELEVDGNSVMNLYNSGYIKEEYKDDKVARLQSIDRFLHKEIQDVKDEADTFMENWGKNIWQEAMEANWQIQRRFKESKMTPEELAESRRKDRERRGADAAAAPAPSSSSAPSGGAGAGKVGGSSSSGDGSSSSSSSGSGSSKGKGKSTGSDRKPGESEEDRNIRIQKELLADEMRDKKVTPGSSSSAGKGKGKGKK